MRHLLHSILFVFAIQALAANPIYFPDDKTKPGDDKKAKAKKDDTTKVAQGCEEHSNEAPDSTLVLFPSHDLYNTWDTNTVHPYNFYESFKQDSVVLNLVQAGDSGFSMPVKGLVTSEFGWRRYRPHFGTDIDLETGDQVVAVFDGMVRIAKMCNGYGNCVILRHNNGLETVYGHLSEILVEPGQAIKAGSLIGLGGNTGRSYGSHLHFEIRYLGQALDAQDFIDFENGTLKKNEFVLHKSDVENKYDLRATHARHKRDIGLAKTDYKKYGKHGKSRTVKVRKGDTLARIAKRNGTTIKALCRKNGFKSTKKLKAGQRIRI